MTKWSVRLALPPDAAPRSPASSPATIYAAKQVIGSEATEWAVDAAARIAQAVERDSLATDRPVVFGALELQAHESCWLAVLSALQLGVPSDELVVPEEALHQARVSVRRGATVEDLVRLIYGSHARVHDEILAVIEQDATAGADLIGEIREITWALFGYVEVIRRELTDAYESERSDWQGRQSADWRRIVDGVIGGEAPSADDEGVLGLRMPWQHLFAVGWSIADGYARERDASLVRFATEVGRRLSSSATLTIERPDGMTDFLWSGPALSVQSLASRIESAARPEWLRVGVGMIGPGVDGFRDSYFTAQQAAHLGRLAQTGDVWVYDDVKLPALLIADPVAARLFARRVLAGMLGAERKVVDLRRTLYEYLVSGRSRVVVAHSMHLSPNTVAYRIGRAEELLGRPVSERGTETLVALAISEALPHLVH